ncbi:cytoplasmic tRNA 2-thiolation protein 2 [Physcia stellaris]|nr:cytoplasmic tRNA 2-thiolation protein 2 [Physcia stellaris]
MEANKVRHAYNDAPKKILLPLSLGVSSTVLLHVLDEHLDAQSKRNGRTSYGLHILFIDQSAFCPQTGHADAIKKLRQRFPLHTFSVAALHEVLGYNDEHLGEVFKSHGVLYECSTLSQQDKLEKLLSALPSATSRFDIVNILRRKLIIAFAESHECSSVVFGDSTTRLAERTLSETAKGRGASLPWLTADNASPKGLKINYPVRDLLKGELVLYTKVIEPPLDPLIAYEDSFESVPTSSKDTTIDGLMSQYFQSVEQNYPSIVANVPIQSYAAFVDYLSSQYQKHGLETKEAFPLHLAQSTESLLVKGFCAMDALDP